MKEFGSDYHFISRYYSDLPTRILHNAIVYADGRQAIIALIRMCGWRRLWVPEYFCYEVIDALRNEVEIVLYNDSPNNVNRKYPALDLHEGDALLVANYFGLLFYREFQNCPVPIIEDHTHDLLGYWAVNSRADWCVASLRKTLPIPQGGVLWSPKGLSLPEHMSCSDKNARLAKDRWRAMELKKNYLDDVTDNKDGYRHLFADTEEQFSKLDLSGMDERTKDYLLHFDIQSWYDAKLRNWKLLYQLLIDKIEILSPENDCCFPFSLVMLLSNKDERNRVREHLISDAVYPAILWRVPETASTDIKNFSERMLSVHCDGRYSEEDIRDLAARIISSLSI